MKSKNVLSGFTFLSFFLWAIGLCVSAEPNVIGLKWYRDQKTNPAALNLIEVYIKGVGDAFTAANAALEVSRREQPLFCQPDELGLFAKNSMNILDREINRSPWRDDDRLPIILLSGLMNTFPCPK